MDFRKSIPEISGIFISRKIRLTFSLCKKSAASNALVKNDFMLRKGIFAARFFITSSAIGSSSIAMAVSIILFYSHILLYPSAKSLCRLLSLMHPHQTLLPGLHHAHHKNVFHSKDVKKM